MTFVVLGIKLINSLRCPHRDSPVLIRCQLFFTLFQFLEIMIPRIVCLIFIIAISHVIEVVSMRHITKSKNDKFLSRHGGEAELLEKWQKVLLPQVNQVNKSLQLFDCGSGSSYSAIRRLVLVTTKNKNGRQLHPLSGRLISDDIKMLKNEFKCFF